MNIQEVMQDLKKMGNEQTKKTFSKHGAKEPFFGVKAGDLKTIVKKVKKNHDLSLELYKTGNSDAMYLAGLIAEPDKMTKDILQDWVEKAYWYYLSEFIVPDAAAASKFGIELALKWIESKEETIAAAGWATLARSVTPKSKFKLEEKKVEGLLQRVEQNLQSSQNRVKYAMNGFLIAAGSYFPELTNKSISIASKIGKVDVDMGGTSCKVPDAASYIQKTINRMNKKK